MPELVLHFDNPREAQEILGRRNELLARLQQAFGVTLISRDLWVKIDGAAEQAERVWKLLETLRIARRKGLVLRDAGVAYAVQAFLDGREAELERLFENRIDLADAKAPIFARTFGQLRYLDAMRSCDFVFGIGPAGTGKTYLAMAMAVSSLLAGKVSRIILTRPAVEAGENLGFLPGDLQQKVLPYLRPLHDALYDMMRPDQIERNTERGVIEAAPLAYMRGRTLNHAFVILDEAQNTTQEQMLMFLTRLGFDSQCVITGDTSQIDLPGNKSSGLLEAQRTLRDVEGIAIVELSEADVVRHPLVQKIIHAYRLDRESNSTAHRR
ncbi:MAG: PhoH family protein [Kiritimatiellae bacterium]|nr:PhoH family protein [Kiritimatiellia bacterium]MCO5062502.1 PhoH family protein [Kiritimatiellia bacterium]MCO6399812.1 PhoH family protein [Verrucomicrobiota bacterium]